ncbi:hypothetical protein D6D23_08161 [Aureobasidium pullulans]|nr:hypothetical protein D6D23_08161 [Aureobasidium pullulans]
MHSKNQSYGPKEEVAIFCATSTADKDVESARAKGLELVTYPFAEADEDTGEIKQSNQSSYIHIRIQQRNGRKTLTTVQGLPKKFDQKKILKVIKKAFACNGTIVSDTEMGEVIQLQGDQRKDVQEFLCDKKEGLGLDAKTIKVRFVHLLDLLDLTKLTLSTRSTVSKRPTTAPCTLVGYERPAGGLSRHLLLFESSTRRPLPRSTRLFLSLYDPYESFSRQYDFATCQTS